MPKKGGLGKGLEAIFGGIEELDRKDSVTTISIDLLEKNPFQPRETFDEKTIKELAESIREKGLIQPIIVREVGEKYQIVAGERRFLAAKLLGLKSIPAIIKDISEKESAEIALIENIQRKNLNPVEEAIAYKRLIENFNYTQEELSRKIGKDRATVANSLRLLNLPKDIIEKIKKGQLTAGHARAILSIKEKDRQRKLAEEIVKKKLSVREAEKLSRNHSYGLFVEEVNRLKELFEDVKLKKSGKRLKIELTFKNEEELKKFIKMIS